MKILITTAFALIAAPAFAQDQVTGTSAPPPAIITASQDEVQAPQQKPSAAVSYAASPSSAKTYGAYVPYTPASPATGSGDAAPNDPYAGIVTAVSGKSDVRQPLADEDAGIVTSISTRDGEVPAGTLLAVRMRETISTATTLVNAPFTAEVTEPMESNGRVIIPAGSTVQGRVSQVRGGRRIAGPAAIHLTTESVTLPDGTHYVLHAQVVDTSQHNVTRVNDEGTILRRDHVKGTLAAMSLTTGGAAATGAVLGGVPGAFIGAGIGAGISTVWWLKQDRQEEIPENTGVIFSLSVPMMTTPLTSEVR
jgi:hypothetical protein